MVFERQANWPMFVMVGQGYDCFETLIKKNRNDASWQGTLMFVHADGKLEVWERGKTTLN